MPFIFFCPKLLGSLILCERRETPLFLKSGNLIPADSTACNLTVYITDQRGFGWTKAEQNNETKYACKTQLLQNYKWNAKIQFVQSKSNTISFSGQNLTWDESVLLGRFLDELLLFFVDFLSVFRGSAWWSAAVINFCKSCVLRSRSFFLCSIFFISAKRVCSSSICSGVRSKSFFSCSFRRLSCSASKIKTFSEWDLSFVRTPATW